MDLTNVVCRVNLQASLTAKLVRIMKLCAVLILVASLHVSATGHSQLITLSEKNVSLEKVFRSIYRQTGFQFVYNDETLKDAQKISIDVKNATLDQVLQICFQNQPLDYVIENNAIVVKQKSLSPDVPPAQVEITSPSIDITGRVTNEHGEPLAGASVIIKRSGRGDIADAKGNFKLKNVNPDDIIQISFAGYKTQNIKVGSITNFALVMEVATNELDKVVVQAYGTTTQRLATGNIATVTSAEIERQPVMNPLQVLQGKVPGLVVQQTSGYASAPFKVELRGRSVINPKLPSEPLYIIDGVPLTVLDGGNAGNYETGSSGFLQNGLVGPAGGQSPLFSINPNDIESITVLKDADATAIYGSRGANGVIVINTKKGRAGKTRFETTVYDGISAVTRHYDLLNTQQYLHVRREAFQNDFVSYGITPDPGNAYDLLIWDTTRYTDWQKYAWGNLGKETDIQTNFSGGDKQTTFRIGGAFHRQTGITTVSGADQRASVQFNISHKTLNQKLNLSFISTYSYAKTDLISSGVITLPPNAPAVFDQNGNLNWKGWDPVSYLFPFGYLLQPYTSATSFLNSQFTIQYEILKGLDISTKLGYSTFHTSQMYLQPISSQNPATNPTGSSDFGNNNGINSIVEPQIDYKLRVGRGNLVALAGASLQSVSQDGNHIQGAGYINDDLLRSIANAGEKYATDVNGQYKYAAVFGRINYNWSDKYIVNLSARRDGSSKFGPGKQFGNFGAAGLAWIFTEEKWIKTHFPFLSFGKLRGSYGTTGSDLIGGYLYLSQWSNQGYSYQPGGTSYTPLQHSNPDLQWQVNKKLESAVNLGFFHDRLTIEVAWYRNRCSNQLVDIPLAIITGFPRVTANLPATIQNAGLETTLFAKILAKKNVEWSFNFDAGINHNKLVAFPNLSQSPYAERFEIGQPLNIVKLLHSTGVDPQTGLYTFTDKNKDGQIDPYTGDSANDLFRKDLSVRLEGGFGTDFTYKHWQLSLFFRYRVLEEQSAIFNGYPGYPTNQSPQVLNHWRTTGDNAPFGRYTTVGDQSDFNFYNYSDGVYSNASYIRLQNVSVSWDLPDKWLMRAHAKGCKFYLRAENLLLITGYNGVDPDSPNLGALPPAKVITGGLQLTF